MTVRSRKTFLKDLLQAPSKFRAIANVLKRPAQFIASRSSNIFLALILALSFLRAPASSAQSNQAFVWHVQVMESDRTGLTNPAGLAFSTRGNAFHAAESRGQAPSNFTDLIKLTPFADRARSARIAAAVKNPINMVFDNKANRLLILQTQSNQLLEVQENINGNLIPATMIRYDARGFGLQDPQGMTVDSSGTLFILDAVGPRIVRVRPRSDGSFNGISITALNLQASGLATPRGIAFDPTSGHLHVISAAAQKLYELTENGQVVAVRDLAEFGLKNSQAIVFAPSGDQTDDPSQMSLYVADSGLAARPNPTPQSPFKATFKPAAYLTTSTSESTGQIVELSLIQPATLPTGTTLLPSNLVNKIDTSIWSIPSTDPDGIAYWPLTGQLLISDSEIEEYVDGFPPVYWHGFNVFHSTLAGNLTGNCTTFTSNPTTLTYNNFSNEPTGVAINPNNNHIFFSDDDANKIFEVGPGPDGTYCTADDTVTSLSTATFIGSDTEDVAYGNNTLFIASGIDAEVYMFDLGPNGVIGGGDDGPVTHFDTAILGFNDLEGIVYNAANGTLFIVSTHGADNYLGEVTTSGTLVNAYDLSFMGTKGNLRSGLTIGPASQNPSVNNIYIVSRDVDNNTDRFANDGIIWELDISGSNLPDLIFKDGFESGNLFYWTSSSTGSGALSVSQQAALVGSYGLQAVINSNTSMYVADDLPTAEPRYRARFYFDPNSISMADGDAHYIFIGYDTTAVFNMEFRFSAGNYQIRLREQNDSQATLSTAWVTISDAPHFIEMEWWAAAAAGANNGGVTLWIDGIQTGSLSGLDNDTRRIEYVRLGAVSGIDAGTRGTYYLDAFESRRQTYIGPITLTPTNTPTNTPTPTNTFTPTSTFTATFTPTVGPSLTPTATATSTVVVSPTFTNTPTATATNTVMPTATWTNTPLPTATSTNTPLPTATFTSTSTPTNTPTATYTPTSSGSDVIFADSFESGNLSAWTSTTGSSSLSVNTQAALVGTYGMQVSINSTALVFVTKDLAGAEPHYRARFYFDPNSISMTSGNAHYLMIGYDGATLSTAVFNVDFQYLNGNYQLRLRQQDDNQLTTSTSWFTISDAPHYVELDWWAASAVGANNGGVTFWIDGIQKGSLIGLDNDTRRIQRVRLGAASGVDAGTIGTYYIDSFESRRQSYIGP